MTGSNRDLFDSASRNTPLGAHAWLLPRFACPMDRSLLAEIDRIQAAAPFRHVVTPGGQRMSVAMTNCGSLGWVSDRSGYRYESRDPVSGAPWPCMPQPFLDLARCAASTAGYPGFEPDACLINRYQPGARMSLHQDRDELDFANPIVSISLGLPALFLWGGNLRSDRPQRVPLAHGDIVVWGGSARLRYHGVLAVKPGLHELTGAQRINLTLRRAR